MDVPQVTCRVSLMSSYLKHMDPPFPKIPLSELYEFTGSSICINPKSIYLIVKISPLDKISKLTILNIIPTCPRHSKCSPVRHGCSHKWAALPASGSSHFCCLTWSKVWKRLYYLRCNRLETLLPLHILKTEHWVAEVVSQTEPRDLCLQHWLQTAEIQRK